MVEIDLARCLFCGQCVDSCPEGAIAVVARNRLGSDLRWNMVRGESVNSLALFIDIVYIGWRPYGDDGRFCFDWPIVQGGGRGL